VANLDDFTPVADADGELDLSCPHCHDWINARPTDQWLSLGELRELARTHLQQRHPTVIDGEAAAGRAAPGGVATLRTD
jgi:hypothetical protein